MSSEPEDGVETPPEKAFAAVGDETRIEILRALAQDLNDPVSFSELRDRVGVRDSGQFNYHLGKLQGRFVRKTDEGYTTTYAGRHLYGAILAGTYTESGAIEPIELDDSCPMCGEPVAVRYEEERVHISCTECDEFRNEFSMPPGVVDGRDRDALPETFDRWLRLNVDRIVSGFCAACEGPTTPSFDRIDDELAVVYECERCGDHLQADPAGVVLSHPAVVSFYYDHGIDVRREPLWRLLGPNYGELKDLTRVVEEDPLRVRISFERDGDRLDLVLDETAEVVEVDRTTVDA